MKFNINIDHSFKFNQLQNHISVSIYPNPAQHQLYIKTNDYSKIKEVRLADAKGAILYSTKDVRKAIPVFNLSNGIYILNIYDANGNVTTKKIIRR